ncbi:MAG: hypothetical protein OQK46_04265 [Gammaproteobacteria bacterium]|nr:hypothetical protein [Gammaproteobacteria bacterium]
MLKSGNTSKIIKQKGAALLAFFMAIILTGAVFLISDLGPDLLRSSAENKTSQSLAKAKSALLSYAISYYYTNSASGNPHAGYHGLLPCPGLITSTLDEGLSSGQCGLKYGNSIGWFPWKSLDIEPLKDSSGECLWYALSGDFYNSPESDLTNDDTPGMFQIFNENGVIYKGNTPEDRVVAVIIAPGKPLSNQNRNSVPQNSPYQCKVANDSVTISNYLDNFQGINNAQVTNTPANQIDRFINSNGLGHNTSLNDRIITITAAEIFDAIKDNDALYTDKINNLAGHISDCLISYAEDTNDAITTGGGGSSPTCIDSCNNNCDADRNLCMLSANTGPQRAACNRTRRDCRSSCRTSCSGGGGGGTAYLFPWPSVIDVGDDFRDIINYSDQANLVNTVGRLPFNTSISATATATTLTNIFSAGSCEFTLNDTDYEYRRLWEFTKDQWFFIVNENFQPGIVAAAQDSSTCTSANCLTVNGNNYAAALIFSGDRLETPPFNQLRQDPYIEAGTVIGNLKTELNNYLEGSNNTVGSNLGDYTGLPAAQVNDRIYCLSVNSSATPAVNTSYDLISQLPVCN